MQWFVEIANARRALAQSTERHVQPLSHGSMRCVLYAPHVMDRQTPHSQDEIYVVTAGSGWFERADERIAFASGDVIFVPAGMTHTFSDFTDDFECWAIFWGPEGGER